MRYVSTRGSAPVLNFEEALLTGLARDGGLYVPETIPTLSREDLADMATMSYEDVAFKVMRPFIGDTFTDAEFKQLIANAYAGFNHTVRAPLVQLDQGHFLLELFHGPTLAFKDFALQLLGRLLDHVLERRQERVVIMGATSGDTGSAAIEGCRHCQFIDIFILHPDNRVSEVQRRQMTTVVGENIHNLAIGGNFDDCQAMVKASFLAEPFLPDGRALVAVNSINWARIMAQIVYYFYAALALGAPERTVNFSVPTGNFGDIFAGYLARGMGLPIDQLVIATNRNDVLHRLLSSGEYAKLTLEQSVSPSMDITVSSNFERLMFDLYDRDGVVVNQLMSDFQNGSIQLSDAAMSKARELFSSYCVSDDETCEEIAAVWAQCGYLVDHHSAIGTRAARFCQRDTSQPMVTLATAHPAKFPAAIENSGIEQKPVLPAHLADLFDRPERFTVLPNDLEVVQQHMVDCIAQ